MRNRLHVPIRCAALIDAPEPAVRRALASSQVWTRTSVALGGRLDLARFGSTLTTGDLIRFVPAPGRRPWFFQVDIVDGLPQLDSVKITGRSTVKVRFHASSSGSSTLATVDFAVSSRLAVLNASYRPALIRFGEMLLGITTLIAREPVRVVAGAVISDGRVLLARRRSPAGRWELPGGKVEPGESDEEALERELFEELAIRTKVSRRIGPIVQIAPGMALVCYRATPTHDDAIQLVDHDAFQWVDGDGLAAIDFLDSDRELVDSLRNTLQI